MLWVVRQCGCFYEMLVKSEVLKTPLKKVVRGLVAVLAAQGKRSGSVQHRRNNNNVFVFNLICTGIVYKILRTGAFSDASHEPASDL